VKEGIRPILLWRKVSEKAANCTVTIEKPTMAVTVVGFDNLLGFKVRVQDFNLYISEQ